MNDLENLPFFLTAGFLYVFTEPSLHTHGLEDHQRGGDDIGGEHGIFKAMKDIS